VVRSAEIVGVPREDVPTTVDSLRRYIETVELRQATPAAKEAIATVLDPPDLEEEMRDLWRDLGQVAVGTLPGWAREMYGFPTPPAGLMEREPVRQLLGALKGVLMKLGQMASYIYEDMPATFRASMSRLQHKAPPMTPALAAAVIAEELGAPPERVFAEWDPLPFAAASIGQVHRAITL